MNQIPTLQENIIKAAYKLRQNAAQAFFNWHEEYGDNYIIKFPRVAIVTRSPKFMRHILHDNYLNYPKDDKSATYVEMDRMYYNKNSLFFTSDFDFWKKNRTIATPAFIPSKLAEMTPRFFNCTSDILYMFEDALKEEKPINIKQVLAELTLKNMLYNLFENCSVDFAEFHSQMKESLSQLNNKVSSLTGIKWLLPTKDGRLRKHSAEYVRQTAQDIIRQREGDPRAYDDLFNKLISFYKETFPEEKDHRSLAGEMVVYLIAGHDTTASTLNALFMYFSLYPEIENKVLKEMMTVLNGGTISHENANKLIYTKMTFLEALRLQSPLPGTLRKSNEDDQIDGIKIPANTTIYLNFLATNRHPSYWDNPEAFIPERFDVKRWGQDEQYAYVPFGGGPRMCIGMNFALLEAIVILAVILPKYRLTLMSGRERYLRTETLVWPGGSEEMVVARR